MTHIIDLATYRTRRVIASPVAEVPAWRPQANEPAEYYGHPVRVLETGPHQSRIEYSDGDHAWRQWVPTKMLQRAVSPEPQPAAPREEDAPFFVAAVEARGGKDGDLTPCA